MQYFLLIIPAKFTTTQLSMLTTGRLLTQNSLAYLRTIKIIFFVASACNVHNNSIINANNGPPYLLKNSHKQLR